MSTITVLGLGILPSAVLCAVIAKVDERPIGRWFLYGLFLGVFGLVFLVFNANEDKQARIPLRIMLLQAIMWALMLIGAYQTTHGYLVK